MATGFAKLMAGQSLHIDNAGISPYGNDATKEAIDVMCNDFGIDISDHHPKRFDESLIDPFDLIVAMDAYVHEYLKRNYNFPSGKLIAWNIEDPFVDRLYKKHASEIRDHVESLLRNALHPRTKDNN